MSESVNDYRIAAVQQQSVWVFTAAGPEEPVGKRGAVYKIRYALGDTVPPAFSNRTMTARAFLGAYRSDRHGGDVAALAAAKQACDLDHRDQQGGANAAA